MRHAAPCCLLLIALFRGRPPRTSCAGSGCRLPQARLRLRSRCAASIILMLLLCACGRPATEQPAPEPVIIWPARCARPATPELPRLSGLALLESAQGYALLKRRDRIMRDYITGLEDALDCYEAQLPPGQTRGEGE